MVTALHYAVASFLDNAMHEQDGSPKKAVTESTVAAAYGSLVTQPSATMYSRRAAQQACNLLDTQPRHSRHSMSSCMQHYLTHMIRHWKGARL